MNRAEFVVKEDHDGDHAEENHERRSTVPPPPRGIPKPGHEAVRSGGERGLGRWRNARGMRRGEADITRRVGGGVGNTSTTLSTCAWTVGSSVSLPNGHQQPKMQKYGISHIRLTQLLNHICVSYFYLHIYGVDFS